MKRVRLAPLLAAYALVALTAPRDARAQGWTADLYAGGTQPQGVAAQGTSTSLVGNLRYQGPTGFGYATIGAPLDDQGSIWGAAGNGGRLERPIGSRLGLGAELSGDAYGYHDRVSDSNGGGVAAHGVGFLNLPFATSAGSAALELRGGGGGHVFRGATDGSRAVWEAGARGSLARGSAFLVADLRALRADSTTDAWAGVQAVRSFERGRVWGSVGRWLGDLAQTGWEAGGALAAGGWGELWMSVRQDATDPLYDNPQRRSWNVGFSRALGRRAAPLPAPTISGGRARIRLPAKSIPDDQAVSIAGEFNRWKPTPMTRASGDWVLELPLSSGVYRFAFVTAGGDWFVPAGFPGRMDDDMGGHVAVLVVP